MAPSEFNRLGRIPVLKARLNADLHMADELKNTGKGNLFVTFGEPDIDILPVGGEDRSLLSPTRSPTAWRSRPATSRRRARPRRSTCR